MIIALSLMPASYVLDESIKLPSGSLFRTIVSVQTTEQVRTLVRNIWNNQMVEPEADPSWIQIDILEGRKPNGFSAAAKAGGLGVNVWVTKNLAKPKKGIHQ